MAMKASCLCGAVEIQTGPVTGPYELCHCDRCKKRTGSAFNPVIDTTVEGYRILRGRDNIQSYSAPVLKSPPQYQVWFCKTCGSPLPDPDPAGDVVEIPAGIIDDSHDCEPDKSVYAEHSYTWLENVACIKRFTGAEFAGFRKRFGRVRYMSRAQK